MNTQRKLDLAWLTLVVLSVGGAGIGSTDRSGLAVALVMALKLRLVSTYFLELHEAHPQYGFDVHKGYPTAAHLTALREHGATPAHRRTFGPVKVVLASAANPLAAPLR